MFFFRDYAWVHTINITLCVGLCWFVLHQVCVYTGRRDPSAFQSVEALSSAIGSIDVLRPAAYRGCAAMYTATCLFDLTPHCFWPVAETLNCSVVLGIESNHNLRSSVSNVPVICCSVPRTRYTEIYTRLARSVASRDLRYIFASHRPWFASKGTFRGNSF